MIYTDVVRSAALRVAQHYVQQLQRTREQIEAGHTQTLAALEKDLVQIRHWQMCIAEETNPTADYDPVLVQFGLNTLIHYQPFHEQFLWVQSGLAAAQRLQDKTSQSNLQRDLSYVLMRQGDVVAARSAAEEALTLAQQVKSKILEARAIFRLGQIMTDSGDLEEAQRYLQRALDLGELDTKSHIRINTWLGYIAYCEQDFDKSAAYIDENIQLSRALGDHSELATALVNRGMTYVEAEQGALGIPLIRESIALQRKLGEKHLIGHGLQTLAGYYIRIGALSEAQLYAQEHLKVAQELGSPVEIVWARTYLAAINRERGDYVEAHELLMQDAAFLAQSDSVTTRLAYEHTLASVLVRMGAYDEARRLCEGLLAEESMLLGVNEVLDLHDFLGQIALSMNQPEKAIMHWRNGLAASSNQYAQQIGLYSAIAHAHLLSGGWSQAQAVLDAAQHIADSQQDAPELYQTAMMRAAQVQLTMQEGHLDKGRALLCTALRQVQHMEVIAPRLTVLLASAEYLIARGDARGAQVISVVSNQPGSNQQLCKALRERMISQTDPTEWERQWQIGLTRTLDQAIDDSLMMWCSPAA
jgi:tetratricopeptide (TPR) repeat protein